MKILIFCLLFLFLSCGKMSEKCEEYKLDDFKFCIPSAWKKQKVSSYDSKVLLFVNKEDSIFINNTDVNIVENLILVDNEKEKKILQDFSQNEVSKDDIIIYKNKDFDYSHAVFYKNYYYYDTINGINVLLVFPKKDKGTIGAFFNKNVAGSKFSIYCNNPSEETKEDFKIIFRSVYYKK